MYEVTVESHFSGAHRLVQYRGNCERIHGHNWKVRAVARGSKLDSRGLLIDYRDLRRELDAVLQALDHNFLNEIPDFARMNPTSENLARWIFEKLETRMPSGDCFLHAVEVFETDTTMARYSKENA